MNKVSFSLIKVYFILFISWMNKMLKLFREFLICILAKLL